MSLSLFHLVAAIFVVSGIIGAGAVGYVTGVSQSQLPTVTKGCSGVQPCSASKIQAGSVDNYSISEITVDNLTVSTISGYKYVGVNCAISNMNLTAIEQEFGSNTSFIGVGNATQFYLSNPQYVAFLSQFLNMSDPYFNYSVQSILGQNISNEIQQSAINAPSC